MFVGLDLVLSNFCPIVNVSLSIIEYTIIVDN